ncbi:MAG: UDP-N-acetylmuramate--L-alanine ligase [Phycisphaerales bacterium]
MSILDRAASTDVSPIRPPTSTQSVPGRPPERPFAVAGKNVYLIGVGGSGMAGMARMLVGRGAIVRGSDANRQETTESLVAEGVQVDYDQSRQWLPDECELVVASAAIKPDHPQLIEAERRGIEHLNYAEALGKCMHGRTAVCIAGTHGKSTTTSMLSCILSDAGMDPTAIVGATCSQLGGADGRHGGGFRLGSDAIPVGELVGRPGLLVAESCEFNRSFHNYHPTVAVITAVEADHLDVYGSLDAVVESFHQFAALIAPESAGGLLLIAHDGAHRREVTAGITCRVQTIGFSPAADWSVRFDPTTRRAALVNPEKKIVCEWTTLMPGEHNAMNGATAATLAIHLGAEPAKVAASLSQFRGVDRRSQLLGEWRPKGAVGNWSGSGVKIYDDYGHHPTEVEATLRALKQFEKPEDRGGRLICVFQPHQHSRTRHLLEEFANSFSAADVVMVPHIYFVRDSQEEKQKITAADLVDRLREKGVHAMHLYPFEAIVEQLQQMCRPGDMVVVMGAGPVNQVAYGFLKTGRAG